MTSWTYGDLNARMVDEDAQWTGQCVSTMALAGDYHASAPAYAVVNQPESGVIAATSRVGTHRRESMKRGSVR